MTTPELVRWPSGIIPAGTVLDDPQVYLLVRLGVAEPADEECETKADRTLEQRAEAEHAYDRATLGIHPDDFAAYDQGLMTGYNDDKTYKTPKTWEDENEDGYEFYGDGE